MRERIERLVSFGVGLLAVLALKPAPPPARARTIVVTAPMPIAMTTPRPVMLPTVVATVPPPPIACPVPPVDDDEPIGRAATAAEITREISDAEPKLVLAVSRGAEALAMLDPDGSVRASFDDGRSFRVFERGTRFESTALDDDGRLYASTGDALLIRAPSGSITKLRGTGDRVIALAHGVVWASPDQARATDDAGAHWRTLAHDDVAEILRHDHVYAIDHALVGVSHISDMCDWNADEVVSLDLATGDYEHDTFEDEGDNAPRLAVVDDDGATWRYEAHGVRSPVRVRNLLLGRLDPAIGARRLRIENGALVELCGPRARTIAHEAPGDRIDAVDAGGRPIMIRGELVLRWSPAWGWRVLRDAPLAWPDLDGE